MTSIEREELEQLRRLAGVLIMNPLERAFFDLQKVIDNANSKRIDAILPASAFHSLARALCELKRELIK
jgi:hypothetical protein